MADNALLFDQILKISAERAIAEQSTAESFIHRLLWANRLQEQLNVITNITDKPFVGN